MNLDLTNDEIQELLAANNIPIINDETNYWFVRTSAGKHFEDFYFGQYIIGSRNPEPADQDSAVG